MASRTDAPLILVVDDDVEMRAMLRDFLGGAGFQTDEGADGEALAQLVPRINPALVILDHEMPGDWGLEILPALRQRHPDIPVILVTAFGGPHTREAALRLGVAGYLDKPFRMTALLAMVRGILAPAASGTAVVPRHRAVAEDSARPA